MKEPIASAADAADSVGRYVIAVAAAFLPRRVWTEMEEHLPIYAATIPSALLGIIAGFAIGIPGFLRYAWATASTNTDVMLKIATKDIPSSGGGDVSTAAPVVLTALSGIAFVLFTPLGQLSAYLAASGALRLAAAFVDEPLGDPILTALDAWATRRRRRVAAERAVAERARLGGDDVPDLVMTGPRAGVPVADLAVVSARPKPGWEEGVLVITDEGWFRIGRVFEEMHPGGLRTIYPLKKAPETEVLRRAVTYRLPRTPPSETSSEPAPPSRRPRSGSG